MNKITKRFTAESAHYLPDHLGKCKNLHGHSYKIEVTVRGDVGIAGPENGMVMDFGNLSQIVKEKVIEKIDHKILNALIKVPTAENLAEWIFDELAPAISSGVEVDSVRVWETENSYAEYRED